MAVAGRRLAGAFAEDGAGHEAGAAGVVFVEQSPDQFSGGVKARDGFVSEVLDRIVFIDFQAAEGEGDARCGDEGGVGRFIDGQGPVAFRGL